jgi:arylsulfatase A-like enzyme
VINLILIDCHDLGRHLACYGRGTVPSPCLDSLAAQGARFTNSFSTAPQCSPSRAALYTGRYSHANGMLGLAHDPFGWRLHSDEVHLARHLRDAGYRTAQAGVQHVTEPTAGAVAALGFMEVRPAGAAPQVADQAIAFLRQGPPQPFFLNVGFAEPHRDRHGRFGQAPADSARGVQVPPYLPQTPESRQEFAELQGVIGRLDTAIGRIWACLQELDLLRSTWLIFTTDHGLAMPRAKCTLYDPGIETALLMVAPSLGLSGGRVFDELISHVDLVPTILATLGLPLPANLQGSDFSGLMRGTEHQPRSHVFAEKTFHTAYEPQRAVRSARHKLIWNAEVDLVNVPADVMRSPIYPQMIEQIAVERPPFELYDLAADPAERRNLAARPDYAGALEDLRGRLLDWMEKTGDPILQGPIASPFYHRALRLLAHPP